MEWMIKIYWKELGVWKEYLMLAVQAAMPLLWSLLCIVAWRWMASGVYFLARVATWYNYAYIIIDYNVLACCLLFPQNVGCVFWMSSNVIVLDFRHQEDPSRVLSYCRAWCLMSKLTAGNMCRHYVGVFILFPSLQHVALCRNGDKIASSFVISLKPQTGRA